jgi:hypothetical protein
MSAATSGAAVSTRSRISLRSCGLLADASSRLRKTATIPFIGNLSRRRHAQRFPQNPFGARFRIGDRAAVGRDAAQPAGLEDTLGGKVANPLLQDELRRIGEFGATAFGSLLSPFILSSTCLRPQP